MIKFAHTNPLSEQLALQSIWAHQKGSIMKNKSKYITGFAVLALASTFAFAAGEECDSKKHNQASSSKGTMFNSADANNDGAISKSEFDDYYAKHNNQHFTKMDANQDGKLTQNEMHKGHKAPAGATTGTTHLDRRFNAADADHNGGLNTTEAKHMPMLTQYFKQIDTNSDGQVTRQEYFDAMPLLHSGKSMSGSKVQSL